MQQADLRRAILQHANLQDTDLRGAILPHMDFLGTIESIKTFTTWPRLHGSLLNYAIVDADVNTFFKSLTHVIEKDLLPQYEIGNEDGKKLMSDEKGLNDVICYSDCSYLWREQKVSKKDLIDLLKQELEKVADDEMKDIIHHVIKQIEG